MHTENSAQEEKNKRGPDLTSLYIFEGSLFHTQDAHPTPIPVCIHARSLGQVGPPLLGREGVTQALPIRTLHP